jgi:hypothetical protein
VVERLVGWAFGVVGRLVGWVAGLLGGAGRWVGRQVRTFMEPLIAPLRLLYAYIAARIGTWYRFTQRTTHNCTMLTRLRACVHHTGYWDWC